MTDQKSLAIGLFVAASLGVIIWILLFFNPSVGDGGNILKVRFANIDKVSVGTRVTFAGRPIGEVTTITVVEDPRKDRHEYAGHVYVYELTLSIDSSITVFSSDEISLQTSGLLGERSIAIVPKRPPKGATVRVLSDEIVYAKTGKSVEDTFGEIHNVARKAERTLDEMIELIDSNQEDVTSTIKLIQTVLLDVDQIVRNFGQRNVVSALDDALNNISLTMRRVDEVLSIAVEKRFFESTSEVMANLAEISAALNQPDSIEGIVNSVHTIAKHLGDLEEKLFHSWDKVESTIDNMSTAASSGQEMMTAAAGLISQVQNGEGTIGRLIVGDDMYLRSVAVVDKLQTLMNDINHYGLLFHLDKGFQRQRTKRANELADLEHPRAFRNYFETEIDEIATSLSRMTTLMEKTDASMEEQIPSRELVKVFAEVLRRVESLEDTLKLYNQQLVEGL